MTRRAETLKSVLKKKHPAFMVERFMESRFNRTTGAFDDGLVGSRVAAAAPGGWQGDGGSGETSSNMIVSEDGLTRVEIDSNGDIRVFVKDVEVARWDEADGVLWLVERASSPANPDAGWLAIFAKTDKNPYSRDSAGTESDLSAGGGGGMNDLVDDTTPQLGGDLDANAHQIQWSKGADVASAAALPVLTDGNYFDVTGTVTVTSINTTGGAGTLIKLHFDGILILTHHATNLILPTGANITTAAGDEAEFVEYGAGTYRCTAYTRADGTALASGGMDDLIDDTTPQLGGDLDVNGKNITMGGTETVDGRDVSVDGTKLDGIEAAADVTDAANVAAADAVMDSDFSAAEGFMRKTGAGAYEVIKSNLAATTAPGATDDSAAGYAVGSRWIDVTADKAYVCLDATATAAVWTETTQAGGGMNDLVDDATPQLGGDLDLNAKSLTFPSTAISDVLDEDNMASDSATKGATQQSIKKYVDDNAGASDLPGLTDTTIASPTDGDHLFHDGTDWKNKHNLDELGMYVWKALLADFSITSDVTPNTTDLKFAGVVSGRYCFEAQIRWTTPASGGGVRITVDVDGSGNPNAIWYAIVINQGGTPGLVKAMVTAEGVEITNTADQDSDQDAMISLIGWVQFGATVGGTFFIKAAQRSSSANATLLKDGSFLRYVKVNDGKTPGTT